MTNYQRVNYTTTDNKPSSAYYNPTTQEAYDVYTRAPVMLQEPETGDTYTEWSPPIAQPAAKPTARAPREVVLKPYIKLWQVIPVGLFGLACIWMQLTFLPN